MYMKYSIGNPNNVPLAQMAESGGHLVSGVSIPMPFTSMRNTADFNEALFIYFSSFLAIFIFLADFVFCVARNQWFCLFNVVIFNSVGHIETMGFEYLQLHFDKINDLGNTFRFTST